MKKSRILSLLISIAMIMQTFSLMTITASAAQYDKLSVTKIDPVWVNNGTEEEPIYSATINGRITDVVATNIGGELYAYTAVNNASNPIKDPLDNNYTEKNGGVQIWKVTNPKAPELVQTISGDVIRSYDPQQTGEKVVIKDGYVIIANSVTGRIEAFLINEDGTINAQTPVWKYNARNATVKLYGNYMFVSLAAPESMEIYDVSNVKTPVKITSDAPIRPILDTENKTLYPGGVQEQIATYNFDVLKISENKFRIFAINRAKYYADAEKTTSVDYRFFSIRDVEIADGKYTVTTKLEGNPANTIFADSGYMRDVEVIDSTHIAACYDVSDNTTQNVQVMSIEETESTFGLTKRSEININRGCSLNLAPNGELVIGAENANLYVYTYNNDTLTLAKHISGLTGQAYTNGVYSGFIFSAAAAGFAIVEYDYAISIDEADLSTVNPVVTGSVEGFLPDTDRVTVTAGGKNYTAEMDGTKFSVALTGDLTGDTVSVSASLKSGSDVKATDTATLKVKVLSDKVYGNPSQLTESLTIASGVEREHGASVQGITIDGKDYLYHYTISGLLVYDINGETPALIQSISTATAQDFPDQLLIYNKHVILSNSNKAIEVYAIGNDGKLSETPISTISLNISKPITLKIVDNYLFAGLGGDGNGRHVNVYDLSDLTNIIKVGNTETNYGAHGITAEKISDNVYRVYFISRSSKTKEDGTKINNNGWGLYIADMTVAENGTVSFEQKYDGDPGIVDGDGNARDIELIGNGKLFIANAVSNSSSTIVDVSNLSAPVVTEYAGRGLSLLSLGEDYFAMGIQDGTVKIINTKDYTVAKTFALSGQVFGLSEFDGKLVAAGKDIKLYDGAYTKIVLDNSDVQLVANVKIAGKVEGYKSGDKVTMSIDGVEYAATVDANGNFYCTYSPLSPETVKVKAHLDRDSETLVATETTVDIVNEYSGLPKMYIENQLNILGKAELKDEEGNAIWGSSNRLTSVTVAEVGEKTFAYAGSKNGLAVFDITTPSTPVLVETYNIAVDDVNTFNKHLDVYNGYLITANIGETSKKIEFYQIGSDGKLAAEPTSSISVVANRLTVEDNYLFVSVLGREGLRVYDISDISNVKLVGNIPAVTQVRSHTIEKIDSDTYRVYMIVRDNSNWEIGIYDVNISNETLTYTEYYKGKPTTGITDYSAIKQIVKIGDTLVVGSQSPNLPLEFFDISNPENPEFLYSIENTRFLSADVLTDTEFAYGTPGASVGVYSIESKSNVLPLSSTPDNGQVYQTLYHKGNLILAAEGRMYISPVATEVVVDETVLKGKAPVLSGEVYGYKTGDKLLASINNEEAIEITVKADATFDIPMASAFADGDVAGVQLVIERNGENILGDYLSVEYLGEYAYEILDVTNDDGINIVLEKNFDAADAKVYVAVYEGERLVSVDVKDAIEGNIPSDIAFNAQTQVLKVFVWDSDFAPVAEAVTPVFAEVSQNF